MDNFGLPEQTVKIITNCFENVPELDAVKIFGSRAKGNFKPHSDIDFVLYGKSLTPQLVNKISAELDELPTPYTFDVHWDLEITNEKLRENINATGIIFYNKRPAED